VAQAAFEPGNLPPGLGASPDKMLQARLLSYPDAHRYRIGVNYAALDMDKPRCPPHSYHRDGHMRFDGNGGGVRRRRPWSRPAREAQRPVGRRCSAEAWLATVCVP